MVWVRPDSCVTKDHIGGVFLFLFLVMSETTVDVLSRYLEFGH